MDINTLRGIATIIVMVTFIGICLWAYSGKRRKHFDEASNLPFADDPPHQDLDKKAVLCPKNTDVDS